MRDVFGHINALNVIGDIALRFLDYCKNVHHDNTATVKLVDINPHMLGEGEKRFKTTPYANSKV